MKLQFSPRFKHLTHPMSHWINPFVILTLLWGSLSAPVLASPGIPGNVPPQRRSALLVTATDPLPNAVNAPLTTTIRATFSTALDETTVTSNTFIAQGNLSGRISGTFTFPTTDSVRLTPSRPLYPGEIVRTSVTSDLHSLEGESLLPTQWQFTAGTTRERCAGAITPVTAPFADLYESAAAWGDFDADGNLDLILAGRNDETAVTQLWHNDGDGTFTLAPSEFSPLSDAAAAWGDYDRDGNLDLLLAGQTGSGPTTQLWHNEGQGSFTLVPTALPDLYAGAMDWGDADNDGDLDLLLTGAGDSGDPLSQIWRNDGAEGFSPLSLSLTGIRSGAVSWGDVDTDGDLDLLLSGQNITATAVTELWRNDGDGTFTQIDTALPDLRSGSAAWGDADNDGDLDLLLTGETNSAQQLSQVWRNESGTLTLQTALTGVDESSAAWGDVDNDGDLDILLSGWTTGDYAITEVLNNAGNGMFTYRNSLTGLGKGAAIWGDADNDGDLDILLTGAAVEGAPQTELLRNDDCAPDLTIGQMIGTNIIGSIIEVGFSLDFYNAGDQLATGIVITSGTLPFLVDPVIRYTGAAVTLTGGISYTWQVQDLAPGQGGSIGISGRLRDNLPAGWLTNTAAITTTAADRDLTNNRNAAAFAIPLRLTAPTPLSQTIGAPLTTTIGATFNGPVGAGSVNPHTFAAHGSLSGLITGTYTFPATDSIRLIPNRPLFPGEIVRTSATTELKTVDGASLVPIQWQFIAGDITNRCAGSFTQMAAALTNLHYGAAAWGDYDRDGDLDLLLAGWTGSEPVTQIWRNEGDGNFSQIFAGLTGISHGTAVWGDADNDGDLDILLSGHAAASNVTQLWRNDGNDSFSRQNIAFPGLNESAAAWGDVNNDGRLDLLLAGKENNTPVTQLWFNLGTGSFALSANLLTGVESGAVAFGDSDNDGDLDILLTGRDSNWNAVAEIWRNDAPNSGFNRLETELPGVFNSTAAWGDADNDHDLDILMAGWDNNGNRITQLLYNAGNGVFVQSSAALPGITNGAGTWGDADNDGDLDLLLAGNSDLGPLAQIWNNQGNGAFTEQDSLIGVGQAAAAWGDADNDSDLDLILAGVDSGKAPVTRLWRNEDCGADLSVMQWINPAANNPGEPVTWTLNFSHIGNVPATGIRLSTEIPSFVHNVAVASSGAVITSTGEPGYSWQVQDLLPGQGGILTLTGVLSAPLAAQVFTSTAVITTLAADGNPGNNAAPALLTVRNLTPEVAPESYTVPVGHTLEVTAAAGVLANDTDANADPLTAALQTAPAAGALDLNSDGSFSYTPPLDFEGVVTFTYRVSDGQSIAFGLTTITVEQFRLALPLVLK